VGHANEPTEQMRRDEAPNGAHEPPVTMLGVELACEDVELAGTVVGVVAPEEDAVPDDVDALDVDVAVDFACAVEKFPPRPMAIPTAKVATAREVDRARRIARSRTVGVSVGSFEVNVIVAP